MPPLAEWIINLGEAAEYMFDHNLYQDNLVGVDFCEQMVKETNPSVLARAERTTAPHAGHSRLPHDRGHHAVAEPVHRRFYREALQMSRLTREMFCLMEGRHVHPSTLYPGGVGTVPSIQLFTEYQVRLLKYVEFMKRAVPLHDDLFNFFYEALPGYEEVGCRRVLLGCWGAFNDPDACDYTYARMPEWGRAMYVTPGILVDGELVTTDLVEINLGMRVLLGSSFYDDWQDGETFVRTDPLGNAIDQRHPWNQTTMPRPQKRDFEGKYTWVMSPRWFDRRTGTHLALDTGGGPLARFWVTALAGLVDIGSIKATGRGVKIRLPKTLALPEVEFDWTIPNRNNTLERNRAPDVLPGVRGRGRSPFSRAGAAIWFMQAKPAPGATSGCPKRRSAAGSTKRYAACSRTTWSFATVRSPITTRIRQPAGTRARATVTARPAPTRMRSKNTPIFEENGPDGFKGIDVMRTVRSFDPCLPCGVHMYLGDGRSISTGHSPSFGAQIQSGKLR